VDAGVGGNESRFINHSCEPNCEATIEDGRIFIETLRGIKVGEELTYDYQLVTSGRPTKAERAKYACRCGSKDCRGTMIAYEPPRSRTKALKKQTESLEARAKRGSRKKFERAMNKVPRVAPIEADRI